MHTSGAFSVVSAVSSWWRTPTSHEGRGGGPAVAKGAVRSVRARRAAEGEGSTRSGPLRRRSRGQERRPLAHINPATARACLLEAIHRGQPPDRPYLDSPLTGGALN